MRLQEISQGLWQIRPANGATQVSSTKALVALKDALHAFSLFACTFAFLFSSAMCRSALGAVSTDKAVEVTVQAFAIAGKSQGINIDEKDIRRVTVLISCIIKGDANIETGGKTPVVLACAKEMVIAELPEKSRALVDCLSRGTSATTCVLPEVSGNLPPPAKKFAECVAKEPNINSCAALAEDEAARAAFGALDGLNVDTRDALEAGASPLQDAVVVAMAISNEKWGIVVSKSGAAIAKTAVGIILTSLGVPGFVNETVVNTVIDNRIDLVTDLISAAGPPVNDREVSRIIIEAYLNLHAEVPCSLIPDGVIKETVCGTLSKIFKAVAIGGSAITGIVTGTIHKALDFIGITDAIDTIISVFKKKKKDCGGTDEHYAGNFVRCYQRGAFLKLKNDETAYSKLEGAVLDRCGKRFDSCPQVCDPLRDMYRTHVQQSRDLLVMTAEGFARSHRKEMEKDQNREQLCSRTLFQGPADDFMRLCQEKLRKLYPFSGNVSNDECPENAQPTQPTLPVDGPSAYAEACRFVLDHEFKRITADICRGAGVCFPVKEFSNIPN